MFKRIQQLTDRKKLLIFSVGIFLLSLTQKTYCTNDDCGEFWSGFLLLIFGWLGAFVGGAGVCWIANPLLILSWIFINKKIKTSIILSGISTTFTIAFLFFNEIMIDEAGNYGEITGYKLGYWLWNSSALLTFIGSIMILLKHERPVANNV
jgi:uncharacterized membrane protein